MRYRIIIGILLIAVCWSLFMTAPALADVVLYSDGFETTGGGYTHSGTSDQWEWGTPTFGPGGAHQGAKCWGTNLDGNVPYNCNCVLTSPPIAVPALGANQIARVRFYSWIAVDEMYDRGEFLVSGDGVTWETKSEFLHTMSGGWTGYYFDVSDYAGGNIYLRWRIYADGNNAFSSSPYNMAGLYVDDVAIIITDIPATRTTMTLEAYEDQYSSASCPWVYSWDGTDYAMDNDIYSTARGAGSEYADYYTLNAPLVPKDGKYSIQVREVGDESSYTDMIQLKAVDHASNVRVSNDELGNIWTYGDPSQPLSAIDAGGNDVLGRLAVRDDSGVKLFNGNSVVLDFSGLDTSNGATLVLRAIGFLVDDAEGDMTMETPRLYIQTQDEQGNWVTRNAYYPRMGWSTNAYSLAGYLTNNKLVRIYATSCHEGKYHVIDYAGLDTSGQAPVVVNTLSPLSVTHVTNGDVTGQVSVSDNVYATMAPYETMQAEFPVPEMAGESRDYVFASEGYYVPFGTYFVYTWDGTAWAQRDGWSIEQSGDATHTFDLSQWEPDPTGAYRVRIWQDYWYSGAGIDYVGLIRGGVAGTMVSAYDLKKSQDVTSLLSASDNARDTWSYGYPRVRDRWVEVTWTGLEVNTPPTTDPVTVTDENSPTPAINWVYGDAESDPQVQYEVEVWTGTGGTGACVWDPAAGSGTITSVTYAGSALVSGQTYYARVRAFDGTSWGGWSEGSWTTALNVAPVVDAGADTSADEGSAVAWTGSFGDPNPDTWTAAVDYGDGSGVQSLPLNADKTFDLSHTYADNGAYMVTVTVTDNTGGAGTDSCMVTVNNVAPAVEAGDGAAIDEGSAFAGAGSFTDPGADIWSATVDYGDGSGVQPLSLNADKTFSLGHTYADNGVYAVTVKVTDDDGGEGMDTLAVTVDNVAPTVGPIAFPPDPVMVGSPVTVSASFTDPGVLDTHTAAWDWDGETSAGTVAESAGSGSASGTHAYATPGIYTISLTVTDKDGGAATVVAEQYVVVYDPNGGFVTGGGWVLSPAGAYTADPTLAGKATFGFVSRYAKGANVPTGNTEFQFHAAGMNFKSTSYDWLVIAGARAQYKGSGTINGAGDYGFMLTAIDGKVSGGGDVDRFRIKVWDKATGDIVYDNQQGESDTASPTTAISGGSIVIHK